MSDSAVPDNFVVDLMDPQDVRRKLPRAKKIARGLREQLAAWDQRVKLMEAFDTLPVQPAGGQLIPNDNHGARLPRTLDEIIELVVGVVDAEPRKIRSKEIWGALNRQGVNLEQREIVRALEMAADRGMIQPPAARGWYAPLSYRDVVIFDSSASGGESTISNPVVRTAATGDEDRGESRAPAAYGGGGARSTGALS